MESLVLMNFVGILREAFKILSKNGRIIASIALFTLLTQTILFFSNFYSIKPVIYDLFLEEKLLNITKPDSPEFSKILTHITKDAKIFFGLELVYFVIDMVAFLLSTTAIIIAAAMIYGGKAEDLSLKDLASRTVRSLLRPLVTKLYIYLFSLVFIFVVAAILVFTALTIRNPSIMLFSATSVGALATVFYLYLSVNWILAIVISVVEKTKGIEALRKAAQIIKGMKLQGFLLNLLLTIVVVILSSGVKLIPMAKSQSIEITKGLITVYGSILLNMYYFAAFTVLYYICKKNHGERVELEESSSHGYSQIPPLVDHTLP